MGLMYHIFLREPISLKYLISGGAENGLELPEDHDDQAGRVFGQEVGEDLAGDLF